MKKNILLFVLLFSVLKVHGQMFHENFDAPSLNDSVVSYSANASNSGWNLCNRLQVSPDYCDSAYLGYSDTIALTTAAFSTVGNNTIILSFNHICRIHFFDKAEVYASVDSGLTWQLLCSEYIGFAPFPLQLCSFSTASYGDWFPGVPDSVPDNNWWKNDAFDLSTTLTNTPNAMIRFVSYDSNNDLTDTMNGWKIDDILIDDHYIGHSNYNASYSYCGLPQDVTFGIHVPAYGYQSTDSLNVHFFFGDGNDSIFNISWQQGGFHTNFTHAYTMPGMYSTQGIFYSSIGINDTITKYNSIALYDTCGDVSGKLFIDNNADCIFNGTDEPIKYKCMFLAKTGQFHFWSFSNYSGDFSFMDMPLDTYSLYIDSAIWFFNNNNLSLICPASGYYSIDTVPSSGNDFAFGCNPGFDLATQVNLTRIRPNLIRHCYPYYGNQSCEYVNGQAVFILDPMVSFVNSNPPPGAVSGDTLFWNFANINFNNPFVPDVSFLPSPLLNLGDTVCFTSIAEPFTGDMNPSDNTWTDCAIISNSCDPNNKSVSPEGNIAASQTLNFEINFQNTGNDTAYNVFILDTISSNLDFSTLSINGASHDMSVNVLQGNVLKFNFDNIMLPDSGANEPASHGFINYSIKPLSNLANGTMIYNSADIYFDFNLPVITNSTLNIIDSTLATGTGLVHSTHEKTAITLFPNPSNDNVTISGLPVTKNMGEIIITDVLGNICYHTYTNQSEAKINISAIEKGIYFISVKQSGNKIKNIKLVRY